MAGWGRGLGDFSGPRAKAFADVTKAQARRSVALRPTERGGFRTNELAEDLARNSRWLRWRKGLAIYSQITRLGGLNQEPGLALFRDTGVLKPRSLSVSTSFTPQTAREEAWVVNGRVRGSIMDLAAIQGAELTYDISSEDPENWRYWYKPAGNPTTIERTLRFFQHMLGDLFEDSAIEVPPGTPYYEALVELDEDAIKLQLMEVDLDNARLGFAINRWREQKRKGNVLVQYDKRTDSPGKLPSWRPGRVLVSSAKFNCSCPDFLGRRYADLSGQATDLSERHRFPLPAAGRSPSVLEARSAGIYNQWKVVNRMRLETAECKHIHAARWLYGCPMAEPPDFPPGELGEQLRREAEKEVVSAADNANTGEYNRDSIVRRFAGKNSSDAIVAAISLSTGLLIEAPTDIYGNVRPFDEWGYRSVVWSSGFEPLGVWCRQNDWWSPTGTTEIFRFDMDTDDFKEPDKTLRKAYYTYEEFGGDQVPLLLRQALQSDEALQKDYLARIIP